MAIALEQSWYRPLGWNALLLPLAWLYGGISALRRVAYHRQWLSVRRAACPLVVVGNIHVGGTGKTPAVIALTRALKARGYAVAIVSRGYGGSDTTTVQWVDADSDPARVGDEAVVLAAQTGAPVVVCKDRAAAAAAVVEKTAGQVIVSDDGLQHYAMARDFEIVTVDAARRFGNGHLLPVGPLREPRRRMATVDWVLERGGVDPFSACVLDVTGLRALAGDKVLTPGEIGSLLRVHAVAGIGRPEGFFDTLRGLGLELVEHVFPDHHPFSAGDLAPLSDLPVVMTEKDAVKCRRFANDNHWVLTTEARLPGGLVDAVVACIKEVNDR